MKTLHLAIPLCALVAGCGGSIDEAAGQPLTGWTRTIIEGHDDGTPPTVSERWIDAGSVEADAVDPACATNSGRLWSGNNFTGAELCFAGVDDFPLGNYSFRVCGRIDCFRVSWARNVHSIKTGDIFGMLYEGPYPNFACQDLVEPHREIATQDSCMKIAERYDQGLSGIP